MMGIAKQDMLEEMENEAKLQEGKCQLCAGDLDDEALASERDTCFDCYCEQQD